MLQKTLITVGASLTAVVLLLFMIQRKKPRPAPGKNSESKKDAGQANNNEDVGTSKDDSSTPFKSNISGKNTEAVTVAPNGVVKTVCNAKVEEHAAKLDLKKIPVESLIEPLLQELCEASAVELSYQNTSREETSMQLGLVQHGSSKTLFIEPSCSVQNTPAKEQAKDLVVIEQITAPVNKQGNELHAAPVFVAASKPVDECPSQQQKQACEDSEQQQSSLKVDDERPIPTSIEESTHEENTWQRETESDQHINSQSTDVTRSPGEEQKCADGEQESNETNEQELNTQSTDIIESFDDEQKCSDTEQENNESDEQESKSQSTYEIESVGDDLKCAVTEQDNNETDELKLTEALEITQSENAIINGKLPSIDPVMMAGEQISVTDNLDKTNLHNLPCQTSSDQQSNGGHIDEPSQTESKQSNEESVQEISKNSEAEQSNIEPLQESSQLDSELSNGEKIEKLSSESGQSNGESAEKGSHSQSEQANGESINKSEDTVEQSNGDSIKPACDVEHYYDNHKIVLPGKSNNTYRRGDYRKLWPQPQDGLIFVKSSAGQPLVPQYLRDTDYLTNRTIPIHNPATTAFLYMNMNKLVYPPENWVRVISVSENLELRVRHDERDMLLEQLEKKSICDPSSKPPPPRLLNVGNLVAAHLDVPRRGLIWCRAHITEVLPVTGPSGRRKGRQPQPQHQPQPLFMVESIDHFPAASTEPVRASDLRPLAAHALQAPFYDQLFCLLNTMPADAVAYSSSARDLLLEQLRAGHNFLRVTGSTSSTFISGSCYWMASLSSVQTRDTGGAVCLIEKELQESEHAMPIYSGRVLDGLPFDKCIFRDGEAFWSDDDRCPSSLNPSCGPPNPLQEYLWLRRTDPRIIQAFRGFKLPYKHAKHQFKCMGFSMSLHEYYTVYRHHSSTVLLTADPDKVLKVVLDDPQALVILDFHMQTLIRFYHFDPKMMEDPEAHVAKDNTPMHMLSFPKDDNGFLIFGNTFFSDFTKENLRIPIMPF